MKALIITLAVFIGVLILGFIAWVTGGSIPAIVAGVLLLGLAATLGAAAVGILHLPSAVATMLTLATVLCLGVIVWAGVEEWNKRDDAKAAAVAANKPAPSPALVQEKIVKVGKTKTEYIFADYAKGCAPVVLERTVETVILRDSNPKAEGRTIVEVYPPEGGEKFTLELGVKGKWGGVFSEKPHFFCKPESSNAVGIWIWQ